MEPATAIELLTKKREAVAGLIGRSVSDPAFTKWRRDTQILVEKVFGSDGRHLGDLNRIRLTPGAYSAHEARRVFQEAYNVGLRKLQAVLDSMIQEVKDFGLGTALQSAVTPLARVEKICRRFHKVAKQLERRHSKRETLKVEDEYDVQDLLHALLRVDFEDVRPETWTPTYAGKSSRMDFQLPRHELVVEVKKTRDSLSKTKDVADQLIVDIERYKPSCSVLVCFVYDPDGHFGNPAELEDDLSREEGDLQVVVIVSPQI